MTTDPKALADELKKHLDWQLANEMAAGFSMHLSRETWATILAALRAPSSAETMREALKPFAEAATAWGDSFDGKWVVGGSERAPVRVEHLRSARAALDAARQEGEEPLASLSRTEVGR